MLRYAVDVLVANKRDVHADGFGSVRLRVRVTLERLFPHGGLVLVVARWGWRWWCARRVRGRIVNRCWRWRRRLVAIVLELEETARVEHAHQLVAHQELELERRRVHHNSLIDVHGRTQLDRLLVAFDHLEP